MGRTGRYLYKSSAFLGFVAIFLGAALCMPQPANRITILNDVFGKSPTLKKDWGFSALVEYGGKRILFDTGNNADIFAQNVKALGVDLKKLDLVVISHRHVDHTSGLNYLLNVNPQVKIYVPGDDVFGGVVPVNFYRRLESLPPEMQYFGGLPKETLLRGTPWPQANFVKVDRLTEIAPGIYLIPTVSQVPGTLELPEISLSIRTPKGQVLVDGCSHAGVEKIVDAATAVDPHIHLIFGGLHLLKTPDSEIERIATALHDKWKVERIAPGHCRGEPAFAIFQKVFGAQYLYADLGTVIELP